ncbi:DUF305 domain-containing protein [Actinotalea solisilvae]|uniref:DUF305 domain-containing protein n=1 Tax=Actinotalea solisilvae TaxID=2072922 RepID=UPI0018F1DF6F|nr:DUF305 domain-containing protein [Actinotalea solisilvae]
MTRTRRSLAAVSGALLLAASLTACAGTADETGPAAETSASPSADETAAADAHNDADTQFAQMMVVHHEGAIEMAELAVERGGSEEVRALGERIAAAQGPEIDTMTSWLEAWGEEAPAGMDMGGMDHGDMQMDGMDQEMVMGQLSDLTGAEFDRRFLELMIEHHRGAISMSEQHREEGRNPEAIQLSGDIIDAQTTEIAEMTDLLATL